MAFSCGFFNSKDLDRVYKAEDFTSYLSSFICNGILDTYGDCFSISFGTGESIIIGTGKAWINGHYFCNDTSYTLDLSQYADESLSRYVLIGISCDTSDAVRNCQLEVLQGTAATDPEIPSFTNTSEKTYLTLAAVLLRAGVDKIISITDYRANESKCGYCKCILGKCGVTQLQEQEAALEKRLAAAEQAIAASGVEVLESGSCGSNAEYTLYTNGVLQITGSGATDDQHETSQWARSGIADSITKIIVDDGITRIGEHFFHDLSNAQSVQIPQTVSEIGTWAFGGCSKISGLSLPGILSDIQANTFNGTSLTALSIPVSVQTIQMFAFNGTAIENLIYAGTTTQWGAVDKKSDPNTPSLADSWDTTCNNPEAHLTKVICTNGNYVRNDSGAWEVES
ncbi:leucine-rich repeat domain-containing protein [Ruminococcus sp.]|uniref:leucine-rich repeat domain-containing protein n=1 Tax=Ruminococcus sp. TaxID=41978 RepID=UPI0025CD4A28|nr:leucine-rich repeat domain-containing protein [Ruminococcus sp.]